VIEGEFQDTEGAEAIRSSHGDFGLVVHALHHAAGKLLPGLEMALTNLTNQLSDEILRTA
jgi:hypothetical protein